jgi:hypothetical protein
MSEIAERIKQANDLLDYFDSTVYEVSQAGDYLLKIIAELRAIQAASSSDFARQLAEITADKQSADARAQKSDERARLSEAETGRTRTDLAQVRAELQSALEAIKDDAVALAKAREAGEAARLENEKMAADHAKIVDGYAKTVEEVTAQRNEAISTLATDRAEFDKAMEALLERLGKVYQFLSEENQDVIKEANGQTSSVSA